MSEDTQEKGKSITRRDFLKVAALSASAIAAKQTSERLNLQQKAEVLKVGDLNVHLLPFDHIEGAGGVPKAREAYEKIKAGAPDAVPLIEYFPPEIMKEVEMNVPKPGEKVSSKDEFGLIYTSYGTLLDGVKADKVIVADPAYNYNFLLPEALPPAVHMGAVVGGLSMLHKLARENADIGKAGNIATAAVAVSLVGLGASGGYKNIKEIGSGTTAPEMKSSNEPFKGPFIISEADFRMLTVAQAIEQLGNTTEQTGIKDIILIYPPAHIDRLRDLLTQSPVSWILRNVKSEFYRKLYSALNIMKVREWTKKGTEWEKTKETPIGFDFLKPPGI